MGEGDPLEKPRLLLTTIPYAMLMICLGFLVVALMVSAWPGSRGTPPPSQPIAAEIGTAPKGWIQDR
jgi:hypothetical protein